MALIYPYINGFRGYAAKSAPGLAGDWDHLLGEGIGF